LRHPSAQTLSFEPGPPGGALRVVVECMNAAPEGPALRGGGACVLLAPAPATSGGSASAAASGAALAALLASTPLAAVLHAPGDGSATTAALVAAASSSGASGARTVQARACTHTLACECDASVSAACCLRATARSHPRAPCPQELPALGGGAGGEQLRAVWARAERAWAAAAAAAAAAPGEQPGETGGAVLLLADAPTLAAVLCHALVRARGAAYPAMAICADVCCTDA
jgi:hypothetical protein